MADEPKTYTPEEAAQQQEDEKKKLYEESVKRAEEQNYRSGEGAPQPTPTPAQLDAVVTGMPVQKAMAPEAPATTGGGTYTTRDMQPTSTRDVKPAAAAAAETGDYAKPVTTQVYEAEKAAEENPKDEDDK
jgi:hypothetical protein